MSEEVPLGRRFSQVYLKRGEPVEDSPRMRRRLCAAFDVHAQYIELSSVIRRRLGVTVPSRYNYIDWDMFFDTCKLRDLLDTITLIAEELRQKGLASSCGAWIGEVAAIFREENASYSVDRLGGVHFFIDAEFDAVRVSALGVLNSARYANVRDQFERAHAAMDNTPPDGKAAVRGVFAAVEGLFRLMFQAAPRLAGDQIERQLRALVVGGDDETAARASGRWVNSFKEWVESAHFYRHEPGTEEPAQPPLPLAVGLLSSGGVYLRWLAELDRAQGQA